MENLTGLTVGLDMGDQHTHLCLLDSRGKVVEEDRLPTTKAAISKRFPATAPLRIALEAGTHSSWDSQLLSDLGHEVLVANPRKLRLIYLSDRKNDRADAQSLARLARLDPHLLGPIQHRSRQASQHLAVLRSRDLLVKTRTALITHVRGVVKAAGARLPSGSTGVFHDRTWMAIPQELRPALLPIYETLAVLSSQIRGMDKQIETLARETYPVTERLLQVPGVGSLTALAFVLTLENPHRFKKSRLVGTYLGLTPRQDRSGQIDKQLRITKAGDTALRHLLVLSSQHILGPFGPDTDLRRWGLALAERGGKNAKKRAIVAVARKLAILLHRLWVTGEPYRTLRQDACL